MPIKVGDQIYHVGKEAVNLDYNYGPYDSYSEAVTELTNNQKMNVGVTVGVKKSDGNLREYWVQKVDGEMKLVEKGVDAGTSGIYNKDDVDQLLDKKVGLTSNNIRAAFKEYSDSAALRKELEDAYADGDVTVAGAQIVVLQSESKDSIDIYTFVEEPASESERWSKTTVSLNLKSISVENAYEDGVQVCTIKIGSNTYPVYAPPSEGFSGSDVHTSLDNANNTSVPTTLAVKGALDTKANTTDVVKKAEVVASWQTTSDNNHVPGEKLVHDELTQLSLKVGDLDSDINGTELHEETHSRNTTAGSVVSLSFEDAELKTNTKYKLTANIDGVVTSINVYFKKNGESTNVKYVGTSGETQSNSIALGSVGNPREITTIDSVDQISLYCAKANVISSGVISVLVEEVGKESGGILSDIEELKAKKFKTINGVSVEGEGNIAIIGGSNGFDFGSAMLILESLPSYYKDQPSSPTSFDDTSYLERKLSAVPTDGKKFVFFTDTHWDWNMNAHRSPKLIQYVMERVGIKNVLFGGDFINRSDTKYIAYQVLCDFVSHCRSSFRNRMLPIFGNHDINTANLSEEMIAEHPVSERLLPCSKTYEKMFDGTPKSGDLWDYEKNRFLPLAQSAGMTDAEIAELEAECRMNYYYDDTENKIRYIITKCASGATYGDDYLGLYKCFGGEGKYKYNWLYHVLLDTPSGFDVCYATHINSLFSDDGTEQVLTNGQAIPMQLLMGLKTKTRKRTYTERSSNANMEAIYPNTQVYYDFTNANDVGLVFAIAGHRHYDGISIAHQHSESYNKVVASPYNGTDVVDQSELESINGCAIPVIWTICDSFGQSHNQLTNNSVNEQAFDVFNLLSDRIKITRFGAGSDRTILLEEEN